MNAFKAGDSVIVSARGEYDYSGLGVVEAKRSTRFLPADWVCVRPVCSTGAEGWDFPFTFSPDRVTLAPRSAPPVPMPTAQPGEVLPIDSLARKDIPLVTGVLDYFPAALAEVARVSKAGNDKHNPGEPLHWARGKSTDQVDAIGRHLLERGGHDPDTGMRHSAQLAWRALALLQIELEEAGESPVARGAKEVSQ